MNWQRKNQQYYGYRVFEKNKNVFFKIIFNRLKFEEDKNVNIDMVGYVKLDEKKSIY